MLRGCRGVGAKLHKVSYVVKVLHRATERTRSVDYVAWAVFGNPLWGPVPKSLDYWIRHVAFRAFRKELFPERPLSP
jgi:hypothetical protein